jgi:hypothetical protein
MKPHFIDVLVPNQVMYKCVRSIDMVSVSTMFVLDFRTTSIMMVWYLIFRTTSIMMVWYFGGFSFHYSKIYVLILVVLKSNTNMVETETMSILLTHLYMTWFGTRTSIKCGFMNQTSPLIERIEYIYELVNRLSSCQWVS